MRDTEIQLAVMARAIAGLAELASPRQLRTLVDKLHAEASERGIEDPWVALGAAEILGRALSARGPLAMAETVVTVLDAEAYRQAQLDALEELVLAPRVQPQRVKALIAAAPSYGEGDDPAYRELAQAARIRLLALAMNEQSLPDEPAEGSSD